MAAQHSTQPFPRKPLTARQFMAGFSSAGRSGGFSKSQSVNPNRTPNCSSCNKPESEHAGHGDWCPSESEDQIWSATRKFSTSHQGDTLPSLLELIERYIPTARPLMSVAELRVMVGVELRDGGHHVV